MTCICFWNECILLDPNIEISRKSELERYNVFEKVLCNNHYCEKLLNDNDVMNTFYVSHVSIDKKIKF